MNEKISTKLIISLQLGSIFNIELSKLYSSNYGVWSTTGKPVKMSPSFFYKANQNFSILVLYKGEEIIGFCSFLPIYQNERFILIIRQLLVKEEYRRLGYGTRLVRKLVNLRNLNKEEIYTSILDDWPPDFELPKEIPTIGILSRNPIALRILENLEDIGYTRVLRVEEIIELRNKVDGNFSTFMQEPFIVSSRFPVSQEGIPESLISWATACYGELEEGDEWILFMKPEISWNIRESE